MLASVKQKLAFYIRSKIFSRYKSLLSEISKLSIDSAGSDSDGVPWVRINTASSHPLTFFGLLPTESERQVYNEYNEFLPPFVRKEHFGILCEIVSRYVAPRSLPGELVFNPSTYKPLRDPLNDFTFSEDTRKQIASLFRPQPGSTFVDIGAYHGFGTMRVAQHLGKKGLVVAVEADSDTYDILEKNIKTNGFHENTCLIKQAVSDICHQATFYKANGTANSLHEDTLLAHGYKAKRLNLQTITIDGILERINAKYCDFLNITINGYEPEAVNGAHQTIINSPSIKITLAGWYKRNGVRICDLIEPKLTSMGLHVIKGQLGRLLAWKPKDSIPSLRG